MKTDDITRRMGDLSEKLKGNPPGSLVRLAFDSFSDAEKLLFQKTDEIEAEYQRTGDMDVYVKNEEIVYKNLEVILKRVRELYCFVVPTFLTGIGAIEDSEITNFFFKLHFFNFEADIAECIVNLRKWSEKDREEFLLDLKENGNIFFRIPRGFNEQNTENANKSTRKKVQPSDESATEDAQP